MKKAIIVTCLVFIGALPALCQTQEIQLGKIFFPKPFVHEGKDYPKGIYPVAVGEKENIPYFFVYNAKKELLFEELAIIKPLTAKEAKGTRHIVKGIMKGNEYFHIKLIQADRVLLAYFLLKSATPPPPQEAPKQK